MNTRISIFRRLCNRFITLLSIRGRLFFFVPFSTFFDGDRVFASEGADCTMSGKKRGRGIKMLVETRSIAAAQRACYDNGIIQCMISYATMVRKRVRMYRVILSPEYYTYALVKRQMANVKEYVSSVCSSNVKDIKS